LITPTREVYIGTFIVALAVTPVVLTRRCRPREANDDEVLFNAQRPTILTGIEHLATRCDLLDRALVVDLPPIPDAKRQPEAKFWANFHAVRPGILGRLLVVAYALANLDNIEPSQLPRMADFQLWIEAAAPALDWKADDLRDSYALDRHDANGLTLESSPIVPPLRNFMDDREEWQGTDTELLGAVDNFIRFPSPEAYRQYLISSHVRT
jgi:hypothetical protein